MIDKTYYLNHPEIEKQDQTRQRVSLLPFSKTEWQSVVALLAFWSEEGQGKKLINGKVTLANKRKYLSKYIVLKDS